MEILLIIDSIKNIFIGSIFATILFLINIIIITIIFGPLMRYLLKPLHHKVWKKDHKKYQKEFSFKNLAEDALVLFYLILALPLIVTLTLMLLIATYTGDMNIFNNGILDRIISFALAIIMVGLGYSLIEHEENMKKRLTKKKLKKSPKI